MPQERLPFFPADRPVPERLATPEFTLCPLTPAHVELDFAALMDSRAMLRLWSGSSWPQDDFSLADNLVDMKWHDREHRERIAFTFTVLNPAETVCLGCIYVKSLAGIIPPEAAAGDLPGEIGQYEAAVRFWIRAPRLADGLDNRLLAALRSWFETIWPFRRVLFHTRTANRQQLGVFGAAGLRHRFEMVLPERGGEHQFWE